MQLVIKWEKGTFSSHDQEIRANHGLHEKDEIRQTFRPVVLGGRLEDFGKEQKRLVDVNILITCHTFKPSVQAEAASGHGAEEASRLLEGYEFGVGDDFLLARSSEECTKVQLARLAPKTWFKDLKNCADYRLWENFYYGTSPSIHVLTRASYCSVTVMEEGLPMETRPGLSAGKKGGRRGDTGWGTSVSPFHRQVLVPRAAVSRPTHITFATLF